MGNNDYYPGGMLLPGRHGNSLDYRYGFQGQEKDDEVKGNGNSINYKFRMHDPRVGRFFTTDPLEMQYPFYTPYSFSGNKVIAFGELEGLEEIIRTKKFKEIFKPMLTVFKHSQYLENLYKQISLDSRKDSHIVYFAAYDGSKAIGGRGGADAYTIDIGNLAQIHDKLLKLNPHKVFERKKQIEAYFIENNISLSEVKKQVKTGKKVFLVAFNFNNMDSLEEDTFDIVHEINAKDHLIDELNGVVSENGFDGHYDYYDLKKHPSGLTKKQIEDNKSPFYEDIHPDSKAGKDKKEIQKALKKIEDSQKRTHG